MSVPEQEEDLPPDTSQTLFASLLAFSRLFPPLFTRSRVNLTEQRLLPFVRLTRCGAPRA